MPSEIDNASAAALNSLEVLRLPISTLRLKGNIGAPKSPYSQPVDEQEPAPGTWVFFYALIIDMWYYLRHVDHV
jgi:hypothetical protein